MQHPGHEVATPSSCSPVFPGNLYYRLTAFPLTFRSSSCRSDEHLTIVDDLQPRKKLLRYFSLLKKLILSYTGITNLPVQTPVLYQQIKTTRKGPSFIDEEVDEDRLRFIILFSYWRQTCGKSFRYNLRRGGDAEWKEDPKEDPVNRIFGAGSRELVVTGGINCAF